MRLSFVLVFVAALAAAVVTGSALGRPAAHATLVATVGPSYTISLTQNGKPVKKLKAGTYTLVIHDKASVHAFSLDGPNGFAKDFTTVSFVGTKTVTVTLKAGKYKYYCPPHESIMFGHFAAA